MAFFWISAFLGALAGGLVLLVTVLMSAGAPQEAAGAAIACALAVLPYIAARSLSELRADRPMATTRDPATPRPLAAPVSADVTAANRRALWAVVGFVLLAALLWGAAVVYRDLM